MFNKEEAQALLTFLGRVNLNGNEAETMVYLKNKIKAMIPKEVVKEVAKEEVKPEPKK